MLHMILLSTGTCWVGNRGERRLKVGRGISSCFGFCSGAPKVLQLSTKICGVFKNLFSL